MERKKKITKKKDDGLMTKQEYFAMLDKSKKEIENGQYVTFSNVNDLDRYIKSLCI